MMTFLTPQHRDRWDRDPEYLRNRATIRARGLPCARCGLPIAYDEPYWLTVDGRQRVNPRAFHCGHIVGRASGGGHELANLQPEHAGCSIRSGAVDGARRRNSRGQWTSEQVSTLRW